MVDGISTKLGGLGSPTVLRLDDAARARKAASVGAAPVESGKAELSALAVAAHEAGTAPVDSARIERLRAGIADGSYQVDPEKIAAKMISLDLGWAAEG